MMGNDRSAPTSLTGIRARLGAALALALLPVLLLGIAEASLTYYKDAEARRTSLAMTAERSAAIARARIDSARVLLETLSPQAVGSDCGQRLTQASHQLEGYQNLIRFDAAGRVNCAAASVAARKQRASDDWFNRLATGESDVVLRAPADLSSRPGLLAAQAVRDDQGRFTGVLAAVLDLDSLEPQEADPALANGSNIALVNGQGGLVLRSGGGALPPPPQGFAQAAKTHGSIIYHASEGGVGQVYSAAPLSGDLYVILSTPDQGVWSWARLNPLASLLFPMMAFAVALVAVWVVADRVVVRWLHYLQRIADLYAKGRYTVRPVQADRAPPEIRELAHAMEGMAEAIAARDASLMASIAQKDALMREIHHRVKNNLQVITSLVNMQQRALTDPIARGAMSDMRHRIGALALIYRALYQGADLKKVDLRQFLGDLIGQLIADPGGGMHRPIRAELSADELIIDPDKLAPLALFAVEAISNAHKHALAVKDGALHVQFIVHGDEAELVIADEGSGAVPVLTGEGVGRTLMSAFARQLRGRMELGPNTDGGVTARLIFPTPTADRTQVPRSRPKRARPAA